MVPGVGDPSNSTGGADAGQPPVGSSAKQCSNFCWGERLDTSLEASLLPLLYTYAFLVLFLQSPESLSLKCTPEAGYSAALEQPTAIKTTLSSLDCTEVFSLTICHRKGSLLMKLKKDLHFC